MNINLSIAAAPGVSGFLVVALYETSNPNVVVDYQVLPHPLNADVNITFTGLSVDVHNVFIWENTIDEPGGTIKNKFVYDPAFGNATVDVRLDLFLTVGAGGDNPVAGESTFTRSDLATWDYTVERRGFGSMEPGVDVAVNADGAEISLIKEDGGAQDVFGEGEVFIIHFAPKVITNAPIESFNSGRIFSATETITVDRTLVAADIGKSFKIQGDNDALTITLPPLNTVSENRNIAFISEGGNHETATLLCAGTDSIEFLNSSRTKIYLGKCERVWLYASGGVWIVSIADGNFKTVGEIFQSYKPAEINSLFCDGSIVDRAQYARLWEYVQTLDSSMIVSEANWSNVALNNKGRFSSGDGVDTFRLPQLFTPGFVRAVNGSDRLAGSYEADSVGSHSHNLSVWGQKRGKGGDPDDEAASKSQTSGFGSAGTWTVSPNSTGVDNKPANVGIYLSIRF